MISIFIPHPLFCLDFSLLMSWQDYLSIVDDWHVACLELFHLTVQFLFLSHFTWSSRLLPSHVIISTIDELIGGQVPFSSFLLSFTPFYPLLSPSLLPFTPFTPPLLLPSLSFSAAVYVVIVVVVIVVVVVVVVVVVIVVRLNDLLAPLFSNLDEIEMSALLSSSNWKSNDFLL